MIVKYLCKEKPAALNPLRESESGVERYMKKTRRALFLEEGKGKRGCPRAVTRRLLRFLRFTHRHTAVLRLPRGDCGHKARVRPNG